MKITRKELLKLCKESLKFINKLEKNYCPFPIPPNSDSGLDWDIRYKLIEVMKGK